jgi:hypothetical protein
MVGGNHYGRAFYASLTRAAAGIPLNQGSSTLIVTRRESPLGCSAHLKVGPGSNLAAEDHPGDPGERWNGRGHGQGQEYAGTRAFVGLAPALASHTYTHSDVPFASGCMAAGLGHQKIPFGI